MQEDPNEIFVLSSFFTKFNVPRRKKTLGINMVNETFINNLVEDTPYLRGYKTEILKNTPCSLLRRYFKTRKEFNWDKYKFVFSDFKKTIKAFKSKEIKISERIKDRIRIQKEDIYGFNHKFIKLAFKNENDYTILSSILYRLHNLHKFMDRMKQEKRKYYSYLFQLLIDTHLDISYYMQHYEIYDDKKLEDSEENNNDFMRSVLELYYPYKTRYFGCEDLPDFTPCIDQGNIWYDVRPKQNPDSFISALIHILMCKTETQKCQDRNFIQILKSNFQKFPLLYKLYCIIIEISLLGNYRDVEIRPKFKKRLDILESMRDRNRTEFKFFEWIKQNEDFVQFAAKEYHKFLVESQNLLDVMKNDTTPWVNVKKMILKAMDISRSYIDTSKINPFELIASEVVLTHQDSLKKKYLSKLKKAGFLEIITVETAKFYEKNIMDKSSLNVQNSFIYFKEDDNLIPKMKKLIEIVYSPRSDEDIQLIWLNSFNITQNGLFLIKQLHYQYEILDLADNAIQRKLKEIYMSDERDFHLISIYFNLIIERKSYGEYPLTYQQSQRQINALKAKYYLSPWESLLPEMFTFYFCKTCKKWAHPISDPLNQKTRHNMFSTGFDKALWNYTNNNIYCGKQTPSINSKKYSELNQDEIDIDNIKIAKAIRRHNGTPDCSKDPLCPVNMIGIIKKLNGKLYFLCEICATITEFESQCFSKYGLTCLRHEQDPLPIPDVSITQKHKIIKYKNLNNKVIEEIEDAKEITLIQQLRTGLRNSNSIFGLNRNEKMDILKCFYCQAEDTELNRISNINVCDTDPKLLSFQTLSICTNDLKKAGLVAEDYIVKKKHLIDAIKAANQRAIKYKGKLY